MRLFAAMFTFCTALAFSSPGSAADEFTPQIGQRTVGLRQHGVMGVVFGRGGRESRGTRRFLHKFRHFPLSVESGFLSRHGTWVAVNRKQFTEGMVARNRLQTVARANEHLLAWSAEDHPDIADAIPTRYCKRR